jgi:hypothetical protein
VVNVSVRVLQRSRTSRRHKICTHTHTYSLRDSFWGSGSCNCGGLTSLKSEISDQWGSRLKTQAGADAAVTGSLLWETSVIALKTFQLIRWGPPTSLRITSFTESRLIKDVNHTYEIPSQQQKISAWLNKWVLWPNQVVT